MESHSASFQLELGETGPLQILRDYPCPRIIREQQCFWVIRFACHAMLLMLQKLLSRFLELHLSPFFVDSSQEICTL
jgi:hypothetical protein